MPIKIAMSGVLAEFGDADKFAAAVAEYATALKTHLQTEGEPAPRGHQLVEIAVSRYRQKSGPDTFVPDYEIIDDRPPPPPPPTDREKRDRLVQRIRLMEHERVMAIMPEGKRRKLHLDAIAANREWALKRTAEQKAALVQAAEVHKQTEAVQRIGARLLAELDDVPDAELDKWEPIWPA